MALNFTASGIALPAPVTISNGDEIIWSASTGRLTTGVMTGTVVAKKLTLDIKWGVLTEVQVNTIKTAMPAGFFVLTLGTVSLTVYRGTITGEHLGDVGDGNYYYRSLSVSVIEK